MHAAQWSNSWVGVPPLGEVAVLLCPPLSLAVLRPLALLWPRLATCGMAGPPPQAATVIAVTAIRTVIPPQRRSPTVRWRHDLRASRVAPPPSNCSSLFVICPVSQPKLGCRVQLYEATG